MVIIYGTLAYNGSSSKIFFLIYINSQTSLEITADKMQSLLTKQEPDGVYDRDLHDLQKRIVTETTI